MVVLRPADGLAPRVPGSRPWPVLRTELGRRQATSSCMQCGNHLLTLPRRPPGPPNAVHRPTLLKTAGACPRSVAGSGAAARRRWDRPRGTPVAVRSGCGAGRDHAGRNVQGRSHSGCESRPRSPHWWLSRLLMSRACTLASAACTGQYAPGQADGPVVGRYSCELLWSTFAAFSQLYLLFAALGMLRESRWRASMRNVSGLLLI